MALGKPGDAFAQASTWGTRGAPMAPWVYVGPPRPGWGMAGARGNAPGDMLKKTGARLFLAGFRTAENRKTRAPGFSVAQALNSHSDRENVVALTTRAIEPVFSPVTPSMRMVSGQVSSSLVLVT